MDRGLEPLPQLWLSQATKLQTCLHIQSLVQTIGWCLAAYFVGGDPASAAIPTSNTVGLEGGLLVDLDGSKCDNRIVGPLSASITAKSCLVISVFGFPPFSPTALTLPSAHTGNISASHILHCQQSDRSQPLYSASHNLSHGSRPPPRVQLGIATSQQKV